MNNSNQPPSRSLRKKSLMQFGTHIFYGEGIKTEPKYVESMKIALQKIYTMTASDIIIIDPKSGGRNTLSLVKYAERDVEERIKKGETIDHVWIFYDKDSFSKDAYDNAYHKIESKNKKSIKNSDGDDCDKNQTRWHALWSNECFELWVLLHFQKCDSALSRETYCKRINNEFLKKDIPIPYTKSISNLYETLTSYGNIKNASKWAKELDDKLKNPMVKENPSTGIYKLIEYFKFYLEIEKIE